MNSLVSFRLPNQSRHPLPRHLTSKLAYVVQEQFFKHIPSHSLRVMFLLYQEEDMSGNFTHMRFRNPFSSLHSKGVLRTHPSDQSAESQSVGDLGKNPSKHAHTGELLILQVAYAPHKAYFSHRSAWNAEKSSQLCPIYPSESLRNTKWV
jgi:hypothetical protein